MLQCPDCSHSIKTTKFYDYFDVIECSNCKFWKYDKIDDCCRNPSKNVVEFTKSNDSKALCTQCNNCGGALDRSKPLSYKTYGDELMRQFISKFDDEHFTEWKQHKNDESNELYEQKKYYNYKQSRQYIYDQYIHSHTWRSLREAILKRDSYTCQKCKKAKAIQVHHLTYIRLGNEDFKDLISVCIPCHEKIHEFS